MPLQNRVDPFGAVHAVSMRGLLTGNRGIIHDPETRTLLRRRWTTASWIICECRYKGRRREPMGRNGSGGRAGWTELFFLDEVTALAAGHRPCFLCRREQARDFLRRCGCENGAGDLPALDRLLHGQRWCSAGIPTGRIVADQLAALPDGVMIADMTEQPFACYALHGGSLLPWSFAGYRSPLPAAALLGRQLAVVTPTVSVAALANGYCALWHPSAALD